MQIYLKRQSCLKYYKINIPKNSTKICQKLHIIIIIIICVYYDPCFYRKLSFSLKLKLEFRCCPRIDRRRRSRGSHGLNPSEDVICDFNHLFFFVLIQFFLRFTLIHGLNLQGSGGNWTSCNQACDQSPPQTAFARRGRALRRHPRPLQALCCAGASLFLWCFIVLVAGSGCGSFAL